VAVIHETAFQLVEEGDGQGYPRCVGILPYCFSKSVPELYLALVRGGAAANSNYGQ
jgi:hypothetical protein